MTQNYQLEMNELAIGLTKPSTKLGVPFAPFYLSIMICFFGWMFYQATTGDTNLSGVITFIFVWLISFGGMLYITSKDIFGMNIFWMNFTKFPRHRTYEFWGNTDSYLP